MQLRVLDFSRNVLGSAAATDLLESLFARSCTRSCSPAATSTRTAVRCGWCSCGLSTVRCAVILRARLQF